ncbi:MAG: hypothetical protein ABSD88_20195, partial [Candidatus Korobacteraceae bacterium]
MPLLLPGWQGPAAPPNHPAGVALARVEIARHCNAQAWMCNIKTDKTLIPGRNGDISILFRA